MKKIENKMVKNRNPSQIKNISYIGIGFHFASYDIWFQYWQSHGVRSANYEL